MWDLEKQIRAAADLRIRRFERRVSQAQVESERRQRRSRKRLTPLMVNRPSYWATNPEFDPYHVYKRASVISHAIGLSIPAGTYSPMSGRTVEVPKVDGGNRSVAAFPIADEVVSNVVYRSVLRKNRPRLSARSYAYRSDLTVHDAIAHLQSEWLGEQRIFVAQYDFSDYFGSLDHEYIRATIRSLGLSVTRSEMTAIEAFMAAPVKPLDSTEARRRTRGVHQGTSVSLLLANVAATPLDRALERLGVSFTRFADDILLWSGDYAAVNRAIQALHEFGEKARVPINHAKSPGIRLLVPSEAQEPELKSIDHVTFLSHRVALGATGLGLNAVEAVKKQARQHIYDHLIREPLRGNQDHSRLVRGLDRDYVALVWHLRRLVYGNLSEKRVGRLLSGPIPRDIKLSGAVARMPLANDRDQFDALDRWLSTEVWLALRRRRLLLTPTILGSPEPWGCDRSELQRFQTKSTRSGRDVDARLPSFRRMSELVDRAVRAHGTSVATYATGLYEGE